MLQIAWQDTIETLLEDGLKKIRSESGASEPALKLTRLFREKLCQRIQAMV